MKQLKLLMQPQLVAVGADWDSITDCYICVNQIQWEKENILEVLDILFKTFYILDIEFPAESERIWSLIQFGFYGIVSEVAKNGCKNQDIGVTDLRSYGEQKAIPITNVAVTDVASIKRISQEGNNSEGIVP